MRASASTSSPERRMGAHYPHGDRKRERAPVGGAHRHAHYPHGDRKRDGGAGQRRWWAAHYPSWGSETFGANVTTTPREPSLPLMGIGNRCQTACASNWSTAHYPSWGSETWHRGRATLPHCRPHYPSWGSETRPSASSGRGPTCTHYPSWGSETIVVTNLSNWQYELITPHGDRKPPPRRTGKAIPTPHYPSSLVSQQLFEKINWLGFSRFDKL